MKYVNWQKNQGKQMFITAQLQLQRGYYNVKDFLIEIISLL